MKHQGCVHIQLELCFNHSPDMMSHDDPPPPHAKEEFHYLHKDSNKKETLAEIVSTPVMSHSTCIVQLLDVWEQAWLCLYASVRRAISHRLSLSSVSEDRRDSNP